MKTEITMYRSRAFSFQFETIGGGLYMLVSGVPVKIVGHAREMSIMALSMLEKIQTVVNPFTNRPLELQIGIEISSYMFVMVIA